MTQSKLKTAVPMVKKRKYRHGHWELTGMLMPSIIYVFIFSYLPMLGLVIAFKKYKYNLGIWGSEWIGLKNFEFLVKSDTFFNLVRNTLGYNLMFILLGIIFGVMIAVMLDIVHNKYFVKVYQGTLFLPYFLSWIVVSYVTHALLQVDKGLINNVITGFGGKAISFYSEPKYWPIIFIAASVWKGVGNNCLIYYGTILGIPTELYEAASIDGCGFFKKFKYITLPHLRPTIAILFIMAVGGIFRSDYGLFYYLTKDSGALYSATDVLDTYILRSIRVTGDIGASSAAGFLQSIVGLATVLCANAIVKKIDGDSSLF